MQSSNNRLKLSLKKNNYEYSHDDIDYYIKYFIDNRSYKIPSFQRDYVWTVSDIINLLNSLICGEPIGYIILWNTNQKQLFDSLGERNDIIKFLQSNNNEDSTKENRTYIIDGQQRLTTLSSIKYCCKIFKFVENEKQKLQALNKKNNKKDKLNISKDLIGMYDKLNKIVFDINISKFVTKNKKDIDINSIRLVDIFNDEEINDIELKEKLLQNKLYNECDDEHLTCIINTIKEINKLWSLRIGCLKLTEFDLDEVIEIFNNINNKGKSLTTFDLVKSKWNQKNEKIEEFINKVQNQIQDETNIELDKNNFKNLFIDSLYLLFENEKEKHIITNKMKTLKKITDEEIKILHKFEVPFRDSYIFLNDIVGIMNIPSDNIVKWVSYFYYQWSQYDKNTPNANIITKIKQYIAIVSINKIYNNATDQKLNDNIEFVDNLIKDKNLDVFSYISKFEYKHNNFTSDMILKSNYKNKNSSKSKIINSFYKWITACDFKTGINVDNKKLRYDLHHIFPKKCNYFNGVSEKCKDYIDSFANITRISSATNKFISDKDPNVYYEELQKYNDNIDKVLEECFINVDLFKNNKFEEFINERATKIANKLNEIFNLNKN